MKNYHEYIGQKIGKYTILELNKIYKGKFYFKVQCDCGWKGVKRLDHIIDSKDSKCNHRLDIDKMIGTNIGKYKLISFEGKNHENGRYDTIFKVHCDDCGWEGNMLLFNIKDNANSKYCNHVKDKKQYIGQTIGKYRILDVHPPNNKYHKTTYKVVCLKCSHIDDHKLMENMVNTNMNSPCYHLSNMDKRIKHIHWGMVQRCYNPSNKEYPNYGAKGVRICKEWHNRKNFEKWALENGYKSDLTIERIDSDGNYCPENCQWKSSSYNSKFKQTKNIIHIIINDNTELCDTVGGWSIKLGYSYNYLYKKFGYDYCKIAEYIISKLFPDNICDNKKIVAYKITNDKPIDYDYLPGSTELIKNKKEGE